MAANWISDGSEIPSSPLLTVTPPYREWRIGSFEFRRSRRVGRWTCQTASDGSARKACGAAAYRTPLGAFLAVWRILRRG